MTDRVYLGVYLNLEIAMFGILAFSIILIGTIVFVLQALKWRYPTNGTLNNCHCLLLRMRHTIHRLLQKLGIVEKGAGGTDKNSQSTLNGYVVSSFAATMLFGCVLSMTVMILMVFINTLILKESNTCEPGMTCYMASDNCTVNDSKIVYDNCSSILANNTPVICYKYQFDVVSALVAAGGLISVAQVTIHLLILVLHRMARKCLPCYLCALPIIITLGIIVLIAIHYITCGLSAPFFSTSHTSLLKIQCTIFFTGIVSAAMAMMFIQEPQTHERDDETASILDKHNSARDSITRTV